MESILLNRRPLRVVTLPERVTKAQFERALHALANACPGCHKPTADAHMDAAYGVCLRCARRARRRSTWGK